MCSAVSKLVPAIKTRVQQERAHGNTSNELFVTETFDSRRGQQAQGSFVALQSAVMLIDVDPRTPNVALAIFAHPDDAEVAAGATLAKWASDGCVVYLFVVAQGDKGTTNPQTVGSELAKVRQVETANAASILGVSNVDFGAVPDGEVVNSLEMREKIVRLIRSVKPEAVVCPDPVALLFGRNYVNHRDHRVVGEIVLDAISPAAAMPLYFPKVGPVHQVQRVYLAGTLEPDVVIDVASSIEMKWKALACHATQSEEAGEWLRIAVHERAEAAGRDSGIAFGEAFRLMVLS